MEWAFRLGMVFGAVVVCMAVIILDKNDGGGTE